MKLKAQAFLISSIILIVMFAVLFFQMDIFQLVANKAMMESFTIITNEITNIKAEIGKIPAVSYYATNEELIANMENFTRFVRENYEFKRMVVAIVALLIFTPTNITANETTILNVSIFNQRTETLTPVTLNFSYDGSWRSFDVPDREIKNTSFSFITSSDEEYTLDLFYKSKLFGKIEEKILLPIRINETLKLAWAEVIVGE